MNGRVARCADVLSYRMPTEVVKLVGDALIKKDATRLEYTFRVSPRMTKPEIKDYLEKIYGLDVRKVNTMIYEGKEKRRNGIKYRRPDYKKVVVKLNPPAVASQGQVEATSNEVAQDTSKPASSSTD